MQVLSAPFLARTCHSITLPGMAISHSKHRQLRQLVKPGRRGNSELKCGGTPMLSPVMLLLGYNIAVPTASLGHPPLASIPCPGHCTAAGGGTHAADPCTVHNVPCVGERTTCVFWLMGQSLGGRLKAAELSLCTRRCQLWSRSPLEALTDLVVR